MTSNILEAKNAYDNGAPLKAFDLLAKDAASREINDRVPMRKIPEDTLTEAGFACEEDYMHFLHEVITAKLQKTLPEINSLSDNGQHIDAYSVSRAMHASISLMRQKYKIDNHPGMTQAYIANGYGDGSQKAVLETKIQLLHASREQISMEKLTAIMETYENGGVAKSFTQGQAPNIRAIFAQGGSLSLYLGQITEGNKASYAQSHGITPDEVQTRLDNIAAYAKLAEFKHIQFETDPDNPARTWVHPASTAAKFEDTMNKLGFASLDDIPETVMEALDNGRENSFKRSVTEMFLMADYDRALGHKKWHTSTLSLDSYPYGFKADGTLPGSDTPFLKNLELAKDWATASGRKSIFHPIPARSQYTEPGEEQAARKLMQRYREILEDRNDPAYPASQVRKDYLDAAYDGASRSMPTWGEWVDVKAERAARTVGFSLHADAA